MPPTAASAWELRARIQDYLARKVVNPESLADAYVRYQDIQQAWSGHDTIEHALHPATLSFGDIELIQDQLLRFLSIIVYIGANEFFNDFRRHCFAANGALIYADSKLPVEANAVPPVGNFVLQQRFLNEQYLFAPEVIIESSEIKQIHDQRRLPFESISRNVGVGAYGKVDKVGISSLHLTTVDGDQNPKIKFVACKRFHASTSSHIDSTRELDNLQVLKESITSHDHIRKHLAILFHRSEHLILLPWADHLDLDIFFLEGHNFNGEKIYNWKQRFHRIVQGTMLNDICTQMYHIADALEWLHKGVLRGTHRNRVHFAHMDLKPNNVLIDADKISTVGKWVLTDFGISAFKEDKESDASNLLSIRDLYENLTINTSPRRNPGAYQPPEVELLGNNASEIGNNAMQASAGRRGDIWSFGCIFSEALAFALGQTNKVKEFREFRKGRHRNDYFYEKAPDHNLMAATQQSSYRLRLEVVTFLRKLSETYSLPNRAIDCCVETILALLIVDGDERPKAQALVAKMEHVVNHVMAVRQTGNLPNCSLQKRLSQPSSPPSAAIARVDYHSTPNHDIAHHPSITRTDTKTEELLLGDGEHADDGRLYSVAVTVPGLAGSPSSTNTRSNSALGKSRSKTPVDEMLRIESPRLPSDQSLTGLAITMGHDSAGDHFHGNRSPDNQRRFSRESRGHLRGLTINNQGRSRTVRVPKEIVVPELSKLKVLSVSLCPSGRRVVYLVSQHGRRKYESKVFHISLHDSTVRIICSKALPDGPTWKRIVTAGATLAAFGNGSGGTKHVYIWDSIHTPLLWDSIEYTWLSSLITVVVSSKGSIAFVCSKSVYFIALGDEESFLCIAAKHNHSFNHAAFNDNGTLLYTWSFGRPDDCLYIWRIDQSTGRLVLPADSEGNYQSKQYGNPATTIIPYNTYLGCIIQSQGDAFFPAQIRSTQRGGMTELPKKVRTLPKTVAACIYSDHSLLVVEKGLVHTRIWEHRIVGGATHAIEEAAKEPIAEWRFSADKVTQMRAVQAPGNDDVVIILCTLDNKIVAIHFIAELGQ